MPIEFNPSRTVSGLSSTENPSAQPSVKTSATSSDSMRSLANSDGNVMIGLGLFSWIGAMIYEFFQSILSCFGLFRSPQENNSNSSTVEQADKNNTVSSKSWISTGSAIIEEHFDNNDFKDADPSLMGVIVIMHCKSKVSAHFSKLTEGKESIKQAALQKLREFNVDLPEEGQLIIRTITFVNNGRNNIDFRCLSSWISPTNVGGQPSELHINADKGSTNARILELVKFWAKIRISDPMYKELEEFLG